MSEKSPKKPFYKKWWVWLVGVLLMRSLFVSFGGENDKSARETHEEKLAIQEANPTEKRELTLVAEVTLPEGEDKIESKPFRLESGEIKVTYDVVALQGEVGANAIFYILRRRNYLDARC